MKGERSVVTPLKMEHREFVWYVPQINGWKPGMFGRVKA